MTETFNKAYLGKRLQDLMDLAHVQMKEVYEARGLQIPVEGSSTLQFLGPKRKLAVADIAKALGQSHQLISQRVEKLDRLGYLEKTRDPDDARRMEYRLTMKGRKQWAILDQIMREAAGANAGLFREIGVDLVDALDAAISALRQKGLDERILQARQKAATI